MSADALAQAFTKMLGSSTFVQEVKADPAGSLADLDLETREIDLLVSAAVEGVESIGEEHGDAMKRIAQELSKNEDAVSPDTRNALSLAVRQKMMEQLARANILDPEFEPTPDEGDEN